MTRNPVVAAALRRVASNTSGGPLFKCRRCGATGDPYDGFCRSCGHLLPKDEMLKRADELIERNLRSGTPRPIKGLAYVMGYGRIDLEIGHKGIGPGRDGGSGLSKILQKHARDLPKLGMTLVLGRPFDPREEGKTAFEKDGYIAILGDRGFGGTVVSHYRKKKSGGLV